MGYFPVSYDSKVVNYDRRGFIRFATYLLCSFTALEWSGESVLKDYLDIINNDTSVGFKLKKPLSDLIDCVSRFFLYKCGNDWYNVLFISYVVLATQNPLILLNPIIPTSLDFCGNVHSYKMLFELLHKHCWILSIVLL